MEWMRYPNDWGQLHYYWPFSYILCDYPDFGIVCKSFAPAEYCLFHIEQNERPNTWIFSESYPSRTQAMEAMEAFIPLYVIHIMESNQKSLENVMNQRIPDTIITRHPSNLRNDSIFAQYGTISWTEEAYAELYNRVGAWTESTLSIEEYAGVLANALTAIRATEP